MTTKELVTIGQTWERRRGKERWVIKQVWRADREVLLVRCNEASECEVVSFTRLRRYYTLSE